MNIEKDITFICGWGPEEEGRISSLLFIVETAVAMDFNVKVFLFTDGVLLAKRGTAEKIGEEVGQHFRSVLGSEKVKIYACEEAARKRALSASDFEEGVSLIGYGTFLNMATDSKTVITV